MMNNSINYYLVTGSLEMCLYYNFTESSGSYIYLLFAITNLITLYEVVGNLLK